MNARRKEGREGGRDGRSATARPYLQEIFQRLVLERVRGGVGARGHQHRHGAPPLVEAVVVKLLQFVNGRGQEGSRDALDDAPDHHLEAYLGGREGERGEREKGGQGR